MFPQLDHVCRASGIQGSNARSAVPATMVIDISQRTVCSDSFSSSVVEFAGVVNIPVRGASRNLANPTPGHLQRSISKNGSMGGVELQPQPIDEMIITSPPQKRPSAVEIELSAALQPPNRLHGEHWMDPEAGHSSRAWVVALPLLRALEPPTGQCRTRLLGCLDSESTTPSVPVRVCAVPLCPCPDPCLVKSRQRPRPATPLLVLHQFACPCNPGRSRNSVCLGLRTSSVLSSPPAHLADLVQILLPVTYLHAYPHSFRATFHLPHAGALDVRTPHNTVRRPLKQPRYRSCSPQICSG